MVPHLVSRLRARLGARIADVYAVEREIAALREDVHAAPAVWVLVERIALALGRNLGHRTADGSECCPRLELVGRRA